MEKDWIKVFTTTDSNFINLIHNALQEREVYAIIINKKDSSYTVFGTLELYVKNKDFKLSQSIINMYNE